MVTSLRARRTEHCRRPVGGRLLKNGEKGISMGDKERHTRLWTALFLLGVGAWVGCTTKDIISGIKPARVSLKGIRTLAVLKFDGPYGEAVRSQIYNRLAEVQHFRPVETPQLHALGDVTYGQVDNSRFFPALNQLETDGVITGRVTASVNEIHGTDRVQVREGTGYYKKEKNVNGQWVDVEIKRTVVRPVPYIIRQASVDTKYDLLDLKSKQVIATGMVKETYNEKFGGDKEYGSFGHKLNDLPTPDGTMDELADRVAAKLVGRISRTKLGGIIKLDKGGNAMVKQGIELANGGLWEEAIEVWERVIHDEPDNAAAYYNLGVAHETLGDMKNIEIAKGMYRRAVRYEEKKLYRDAMVRVDQALRRATGIR
jgi:hypothetical protein